VITDPASSRAPAVAPATTSSKDRDRDGSPAASAATVAHEVDATGLSCPMPVIELAKAIGQVGIGELVALTATDPAARVDVPVWCRMQRHRLHGMEGADASWRFLVERAR
jgi:TusA-related sulfurtransferase